VQPAVTAVAAVLALLFIEPPAGLGLFDMDSPSRLITADDVVKSNSRARSFIDADRRPRVQSARPLDRVGEFAPRLDPLA
jgi:hypothetical protein